MRTLGYKPYLADQDLWYKPIVRPEDNFEYYAYILLYVDDMMAVYHDGVSTLKEIDKFLKIKPGLIGDSDIYLGAKLRKYTLPNDVITWAMSPSKYIQESVRSMEKYLMKEYGRKNCRKGYQHFSKKLQSKTGYSPRAFFRQGQLLPIADRNSEVDGRAWQS